MKSIDENIEYLASTDEAFAKTQAEVSYGDDMLKHIKGAFVSASEDSVSKATEKFYASAIYKNHIDKMNRINIQLLNMRNKRRTAEMHIDIWRTLEASRRKGNV
jgi:hypothetical protein|tara:strand:- start:421 stop:732 length:312 start_codon:yes stop_codon:yes gene_type:complete